MLAEIKPNFVRKPIFKILRYIETYVTQNGIRKLLNTAKCSSVSYKSMSPRGLPNLGIHGLHKRDFSLFLFLFLILSSFSLCFILIMVSSSEVRAILHKPISFNLYMENCKILTCLPCIWIHILGKGDLGS